MKIRQHEAQLLDECLHRAGIIDCPSCDFKTDYDCKDWYDNIDCIILQPQKYYKSSSVIVISFCPNVQKNPGYMRDWIPSHYILKGT